MNPSTAPAGPNEIVAVANPYAATWSLKAPDRQWFVVPAAQGHEVLAACIGHAPAHYTLWRVCQSGESHGVTKLAVGRRGQPVSSRCAAALKRFGLLQGTAPGIVAGPGQPAAAEAPIQFTLTAQETAEFGSSNPSAVLADGEPVTTEDVGGGSGEALVQPGTGQTPAAPAADPVPNILGIPLRSVLLLAGLAWGGYKAAKKFGWLPASNPGRRRRRRDESESDDEDEDGDEDEE